MNGSFSPRERTRSVEVLVVRATAVLALVACAGGNEEPGGSPEPSTEDSAAAKVLEVAVVDPATRVPLTDGAEVGLFSDLVLPDFSWLAVGLEVSGSYGQVGIEWRVVRPADGAELEVTGPEAYYQLTPTSPQCTWDLDELRLSLMPMVPADIDALGGEPLEVRVVVADLADGAEVTQTLDVVAAAHASAP